jgi:hypothetical protein
VEAISAGIAPHGGIFQTIPNMGADPADPGTPTEVYLRELALLERVAATGRPYAYMASRRWPRHHHRARVCCRLSTGATPAHSTIVTSSVLLITTRVVAGRRGRGRGRGRGGQVHAFFSRRGTSASRGGRARTTSQSRARRTLRWRRSQRRCVPAVYEAKEGASPRCHQGGEGLDSSISRSSPCPFQRPPPPRLPASSLNGARCCQAGEVYQAERAVLCLRPPPPWPCPRLQGGTAHAVQMPRTLGIVAGLETRNWPLLGRHETPTWLALRSRGLGQVGGRPRPMSGRSVTGSSVSGWNLPASRHLCCSRETEEEAAGWLARVGWAPPGGAPRDGARGAGAAAGRGGGDTGRGGAVVALGQDELLPGGWRGPTSLPGDQGPGRRTLRRAGPRSGAQPSGTLGGAHTAESGQCQVL